MSTLIFFATGTPAPKGSLKHVGKGRLVEQVKGSKPWREIVAAAARKEMHLDGWATSTEPISVQAIVYVARPKSAPKRIHPTTRSSGDSDKHARNILDALVDAGVIRDDSQVIELHIRKAHHVAGLIGAHIRVREIA